MGAFFKLAAAGPMFFVSAWVLMPAISAIGRGTPGKSEK